MNEYMMMKMKKRWKGEDEENERKIRCWWYIVKYNRPA